MNKQNKPMSPRRTRKREAKVASILDAALLIATEEGLERLTTHRLAARLDLVVGALYRYFPSKEALIAALEVRAIADYREALTTAWRQTAEENTDPLAAIVSLAHAYQELSAKQPAHFHLINQVMGNPRNLLTDEAASSVLSVMHALFEDLAIPFEKAVEAELLNPGCAIERVTLFWASGMAIVQVGKLGNHDPQLNGDRLMRSLLMTMLRGWGASDESIERALNWVYATPKGSL